MHKLLISALAASAVIAFGGATFAQQGSGQRPMGKEGTQQESPSTTQPPAVTPGAPPSTDSDNKATDDTKPRSGQMPGPKGQGSEANPKVGR